MDGIKGISIVWLSETDLTNLNAGEGESNYIDVKKYKKDGKEYPYVSGQAMRFYLREAIRRGLSGREHMCIPNEKGETCGDIVGCINCDLFGFMTTIKGKGAVTRVSPVKVSPAMGLLPFDENANLDLLTRRHRATEAGKMEGDIVNVEMGTNLYKGGMAIDIARVGAEEKIDEEKRSVKIENKLDESGRNSRIKKVLEGLRFITDYSKQARLMTDFTPDIVAIALQKRYSHRLQKLFQLQNGREISIERLNQMLDDVSEYSDSIFFGMLPGVIKNEAQVKEALKARGIEVQRPGEAINSALEAVR